jgi:hypothetical protein
MNHNRIFICIFVMFHAFSAQAQVFAKKDVLKSQGEKKPSVIYSNQDDEAITIESITFLPSVDNVDGIFARPFDKKLEELLSSDTQWMYTKSQFVGTFFTPADLIKDPQKVIKIAKPLKVDGLILIDIRKNPKDFLVSMHLFSAKDGRLITQVTATDLDQSSTEKALAQLGELYKQTKARIPYDGLILSRTKNRVTINLGEQDGIKSGQELTCAKIIEVVRHPKLGSILKHEKVILGKVRVLKVDKALSFADVISETENGAIQKHTKVVGARPVSYVPEKWISNDYIPAEVLLSENNKENGKIQEWRTELPPTFGMVSASFGLSNYSQSVSRASGGGLSASSSIYPSVNLAAEIWLNPEWFMKFGMSQGTGSIKNPLAGSTPGDLNTTMSQYNLDVGFNLLLKDDFWDSKLYAALGFYDYKMSVDKSTPVSLVTTEYSALRVTLGGKTPIDDHKRWYLGAQLLVYWNPKLSESPYSSGSSDNKIVNFNFGVDYRWSERILLNGAIDFKTLMSDFSGTGTRPAPAATSSSQKIQTLNFGISYMF